MKIGVIKLKPLMISLAIPLAVGALSGVLSMNAKDVYSTLELPALSPPPFLFPIVWTILYILMGISAYLVAVTNSPLRQKALFVYGLQLAFNFVWPLLFFVSQAYWVSFVWLAILWVLVFIMIILFYKIRPAAAFLQIPYLLWITFAGYLNLMVAILNP